MTHCCTQLRRVSEVLNRNLLPCSPETDCTCKHWPTIRKFLHYCIIMLLTPTIYSSGAKIHYLQMHCHHMMLAKISRLIFSWEKEISAVVKLNWLWYPVYKVQLLWIHPHFNQKDGAVHSAYCGNWCVQAYFQVKIPNPITVCVTVPVVKFSEMYNTTETQCHTLLIVHTHTFM